MMDVDEHIENEWYVVRHSGEIPEIALHSSLHFLSEAPDGPRLTLTEKQLLSLKQAAAARFKEIVLRDLQHENCSLSIYRGVKRSIINYRRYQRFCRRQGMDGTGFDREIGAALLDFLKREQVEVAGADRASVINCTFEELQCFTVEVGLLPEALPDNIESLCSFL